jgi:uncharacterized membrane protein
MAIHIWRTERLARELLNDELTELDSMRYIIISAVVYAIASYWSLWFGESRDWTFFFEMLMVIVITVIGVHECYKANGKERGKHFLKRYFALSVPIGVKLAIFSTAFGYWVNYAFPYIAGQGAFRDPGFVHRFVFFAIALAWTFTFFWRIAHHIESIRAAELSRENAL